MSGAPFHIKRDQFQLAWDANVPPVLTVASGSEIDFDALDASCGQIRADSTVGDLAVLDFSRVDQVCGPVFVEGAQPGDTLQVELLDFQPADWGWTAAIPGFGLLADEFSADRASRRHRPIRLGRSIWTTVGYCRPSAPSPIDESSFHRTGSDRPWARRGAEGGGCHAD